MSKRRRAWIPLFIALMGLAAFYNVANSPEFAAIRAIDVIRLLAAGLCVGAAVGATIGMFFFNDRRAN